MGIRGELLSDSSEGYAAAVLDRLLPPKGSRRILGLAGILLAIAVLPRFFFPEWDVSPNGVDEGIQIMAGKMMGYGYDLYSQINTVQPPLMLLVYGSVDASPSFFRALSSLSSLLIIGLVMFAAGKAGGWKVMLASGSFLIIDVMFLLESRLASLDMFSLFWSVLGVAFLIGYREIGSKRMLLVSGMMLGISAMTKLFGVITFGAAGIVLFLDLVRDNLPRTTRWISLPVKGDHRTSIYHLILFFLGFMLVVLLILARFGPAEVVNGIILNQMHRPVASFSMKFSQFMKYMLPITATLIFFLMGVKELYKRREGVTVIIGSVFLLYFLLQAMTFDHHLIFLSPVLALGAGLGVRRFLRIMEANDRPALRTLARIAPIILVLAASSVGSGLILHVHYRGEPAQEKVAGIVEDLTDPDDFIISGDPIIPAMAHRKVPPSIVNVANIQYPDITSDQLNRSVVEYGVKVVVITYHLADMDGFMELIEENFHLTNRITDRQNPASGDTVSYSVYVIDKTSSLMDMTDWGSALKDVEDW